MTVCYEGCRSASLPQRNLTFTLAVAQVMERELERSKKELDRVQRYGPGSPGADAPLDGGISSAHQRTLDRLREAEEELEEEEAEHKRDVDQKRKELEDLQHRLDDAMRQLAQQRGQGGGRKKATGKAQHLAALPEATEEVGYDPVQGFVQGSVFTPGQLQAPAQARAAPANLQIPRRGSMEEPEELRPGTAPVPHQEKKIPKKKAGGGRSVIEVDLPTRADLGMGGNGGGKMYVPPAPASPLYSPHQSPQAQAQNMWGMSNP